MVSVKSVLAGVFAWATFLYFWGVFVSLAFFMINISEIFLLKNVEHEKGGHERVVSRPIPLLKTVFPFSLDYPSEHLRRSPPQQTCVLHRTLCGISRT